MSLFKYALISAPDIVNNIIWVLLRYKYCVSIDTDIYLKYNTCVMIHPYKSDNSIKITEINKYTLIYGDPYYRPLRFLALTYSKCYNNIFMFNRAERSSFSINRMYIILYSNFYLIIRPNVSMYYRTYNNEFSVKPFKYSTYII